MGYKSEDLYDYNPKYPWIIEIFRKFRKREDNKKLFYKNAWIEFHPKHFGFKFELEKAGYFDERPQLNFYLTQLIGFILVPILIFNFSWWLFLITFVLSFGGFGQVFLNLPFKTGIQDCESPRWGYYIYAYDGWESADLVICLGKRIYFPWNLNWYRTSRLKKTYGVNLSAGEWEHEYKGQRKDFYNEKWKDVLWEQTHPYTYVLNSGEVQNRNATIKVREMEWRRRWLMWSPLFSRVIRSIDVEFDGEVGERTGSWKGGTIGCGYDMKPNETPLQTLRRMEKERKF